MAISPTLLSSGPQVRTIGYVLNKLKQKWGKSDARLDDMVVGEVTDRLREVCAEYPYWFLKVEPGYVVPAGFPYATVPDLSATYGWSDRGWLLTTPGQEAYPVYTMVDLSTTSSLFAPSEIREMNYIKRYDLCGAMECDLQIVTSDVYFSRGRGGNSSNLITGSPYLANWQSQGGNSIIRFSPVPDRAYFMCCSWNLATPPWYAVLNSVTNLVAFYYPRALECMVGICYAEFFKDMDLLNYYKLELYGEEGGRARAGIKQHGIIGTMRIDTATRSGQEADEVEWYKSARSAMGRLGGTWSRQPGDSNYISPSGYP